jgi:hypothetical protein
MDVLLLGPERLPGSGWQLSLHADCSSQRRPPPTDYWRAGFWARLTSDRGAPDQAPARAAGRALPARVGRRAALGVPGGAPAAHARRTRGGSGRAAGRRTAAGHRGPRLRAARAQRAALPAGARARLCLPPPLPSSLPPHTVWMAITAWRCSRGACCAGGQARTAPDGASPHPGGGLSQQGSLRRAEAVAHAASLPKPVWH